MKHITKYHSNMQYDTLRIGPPRGGHDTLQVRKGFCLIQNLTRFWCVLPMCLGFLVCKFYVFTGNLRFWVIFVGSSTWFFEKYDAFGPLLIYLFDFPCFSRFDHVLKHCLWCFGISFVFFWWFFNFWTSFADFHDFERFCIHGESKATPGATKMNAFLYIFAGRSTARVFYQCNTGIRIFCDNFVMNFRRFWALFASMTWAKQHREW